MKKFSNFKNACRYCLDNSISATYITKVEYDVFLLAEDFGDMQRLHPRSFQEEDNTFIVVDVGKQFALSNLASGIPFYEDIAPPNTFEPDINTERKEVPYEYIE